MSKGIAIGQGVTEDERKVERVLGALGLGASVRFERLAAGITNLNWLVHDGERTLFLKLYGEGTSQLLNRASGAAASRIAGELGVGPRLVAHVDDPGAEVYEFLDGYRNMAGADMEFPAVRRSLLGAYRRMHQAPLVGHTHTGFQQLEDRLDTARANDAPLPPDLDELLWQCRRAEAAIAAAEPSLAVCHNDSHTANFMINDAGEVRIIDWEYASNNDPWWDLAMMAFTQPGPMIPTMIEDYLGAPDHAALGRLQVYCAIIPISWALWAATQSRISTIPFDFRKHSKILMHLGRLRLRHPAWETSLWAL